MTMSNSPRRPSIVRRLIPALAWLPAYRRQWLLPDMLAGLAVWAVMVPESMAYAGIVGVPAIMGLYTIVPPLVAYALLGSSRLLVVGPDTATGLISALTVGALVAQGTADFNVLTSTLAVLIGVFFLAFGALRMGWIAAFLLIWRVGGDLFLRVPASSKRICRRHSTRATHLPSTYCWTRNR
jgi:MFS superfamily sulfate permease-like transporter